MRGNVYSPPRHCDPQMQYLNRCSARNKQLNKDTTDVVLAELVFLKKIINQHFFIELYVAIGNKRVIVRTIFLCNRIIRIIAFMGLIFQVQGIIKNQCLPFDFIENFDLTKQSHMVI